MGTTRLYGARMGYAIPPPTIKIERSLESHEGEIDHDTPTV
ncbi:hypothetical protein Mal15_61630 [Stieleria maiorica]|uniref:Uncharacterized protein n=1 Tax=Stieleria maiorica TaxID=2795974 RepID=A0A5B9MP36_9BACT|nr:hypothetical protein Mal15_61630 [Stieleria maiorica]